jgi:hypothetical protein
MTPHIRDPHFTKPPAGVTLTDDVSFTVKLDRVTPEDCYKVSLMRATIYMPRNVVDAIKADQDVEARYEAACAKQLLEFLNMSEHKPARGLSWGATSLVGCLVDSGQAGVMENETGQMLDTICIGFSGLRNGPTMGAGYQIYSKAPDGRILFMNQWWIS